MSLHLLQEFRRVLETYPIMRLNLNKTLLWTLAAGALHALPHHVGAADLADGFIAYWPLDELSGDTSPDATGAFPLTAFPLTAVNLSANEIVAGQAGNAISFDLTFKCCASRDCFGNCFAASSRAPWTP